MLRVWFNGSISASQAEDGGSIPLTRSIFIFEVFMDLKLLILIWNIIVFLVYGWDKFCAVHNRWRIPERTLMLAALIFGAVGAFMGMEVFRHKTKHRLFTVGVPICLVINIIAFYYMFG